MKLRDERLAQVRACGGTRLVFYRCHMPVLGLPMNKNRVPALACNRQSGVFAHLLRPSHRSSAPC